MESRLHDPDALPPLNWNHLRGLAEAADSAMETLAAVSLQFNHHPRPTRRFHYWETVSSCRMSGSDATLLDLLCFEEAPEFLTAHSGVQEQSRYLSALGFGLDQARLGVLDANTIQGVYERLCPEAMSAIQRDAPQPWAEVTDFLGRSADLHPLVQAGLLHSQMAASRVFPKANDLMGRLLGTLSLATRKGSRAPGLFLSPYFEKHPEAYTSHLRAQAEGADPEAWLSFYFEAARHQAVDTCQRVQALLQLMDRYRSIMVRQGKGTRSAFKVMEQMVHIPLFTARTLVEKAGMSAPTAQRAIRIWSEEGVVQELTGNRSGRIYLATDLYLLATEDWQAKAA